VAARAGDDWPFTIRTFLFDSYITEHVASGGDLVVNLAAGLDTRPYRMDLPASLRWVEVDLPGILDYKEEALSGEKPRCSLSRVRLDLADRESRRKLFAELGRAAGNALIVTEGLIVYLEPQRAAALAEDLIAPVGFRRWIIDLMSPGLRRMITRRIGSMLDEARAPLRFSPEEGPDVFLPQGWRPIEVRPFLQWAARKKRVGFGMRLLSMLPASNGRQGPRPWAAACLLGRRDT
jgi:methyltransferase (TIGR00027 family)